MDQVIELGVDIPLGSIDDRQLSKTSRLDLTRSVNSVGLSVTLNVDDRCWLACDVFVMYDSN